MREPFEEIREEIEARQRSYLWPDYLYATRNTFDFLWNGAARPKMAQRIGLAIFGVSCLITGVAVISLFAESELGWFNPATVFGGVQALFSLRVLRNAFVRSAAPMSSESVGKEKERVV